MLSSYKSTDTLQSFLGFDDGTIKTAEYTPNAEESILQKYDNFFMEQIVNAEETSDTFDMAHTDAKNTILQKYDDVKQSLSNTADNISQSISVGKNVVIVCGVLAVGLGVWKLIGKDLYYITKGK